MQNADIEGAKASTLKSWRPRTTPLNPLDPQYGAIGGTQLMAPAVKPHPRRRVPKDEVGRCLQSTGRLQAQHMRRAARQRKDFRQTNDISDIEGSAPKPLIGRTSSGCEVRRDVAPITLTSNTWVGSEPDEGERRPPARADGMGPVIGYHAEAPRVTLSGGAKHDKDLVLANAGFPSHVRERIIREGAGGSNPVVHGIMASGRAWPRVLIARHV